MTAENDIISPDDTVLVTGAAGFVGHRVVANLLDRGFTHVRCLVRPTSNLGRLSRLLDANQEGKIEIVVGNLLEEEDCLRITKDVAVIYHLAAGTGTKSFADAFLNSVVTTRNLLEASLQHESLKRFVNLSSFAVYTNKGKPRRRLLDESCPVEKHPEERSEAYCFAKLKQDQLVIEYGKKQGIPFVLLRPGVVYGPGKHSITGRIGIDTFGIFLHLGGSNPIPFTYVNNCAEAIVVAGLRKGIDGEVFNIVDDNLPSSREFLRLYKRNVKTFRSIYVPHFVSYVLCLFWEKYSSWSEEQLPPVFTRREWTATWKKTEYSNQKLKDLLGWRPEVPTPEGMSRFFKSCSKGA
jgi:nucleoside-diphosphate-sugar epimerase